MALLLAKTYNLIEAPADWAATNVVTYYDPLLKKHIELAGSNQFTVNAIDIANPPAGYNSIAGTSLIYDADEKLSEGDARRITAVKVKMGLTGAEVHIKPSIFHVPAGLLATAEVKRILDLTPQHLKARPKPQPPLSPQRQAEQDAIFALGAPK